MRKLKSEYLEVIMSMHDRVKLKERETSKAMVSYMKRPDLWANRCGGCGKVFKMEEYCNEEGRGELSGTFDRCVGDDGNTFGAACCSFLCAQAIFDGKWRDMDAYKHFADAGAKLVRARICVTAMVKDEKQLVDEWHTTECKHPDEVHDG